MAGLEDMVKKAFYMGVGFAAYATEKANVTLAELRTQAQKLADEMVERGEITTEEARKFVDELVKQAQQGTVSPASDTVKQREPRRIEIIAEDDEPEQSKASDVDSLRQQVQSLQEELRRLKQK